MATLEDVVDLARVDLNDDDKDRYSDGMLLKFANNYIQQAIIERADLFLGSYSSLPSASLALSDTFPMPDQYIRSCADYCIGRSSMLSNEEASMTKAAGYLQLSAKEGGIA